MKLGVESLLFHVKRNQLRWFWHLIRIQLGHLPLEVFHAHSTWRKPWGRTKTPQEEQESVAGERDVCKSGWMKVFSFVKHTSTPTASNDISNDQMCSLLLSCH